MHTRVVGSRVDVVTLRDEMNNRELKRQTFLTTRTAEKPRKTGSRPSFLA